MVLHNNKWDRKATKAYNRKHGIQEPPKKTTILPKDHWKHSDGPERELPETSEQIEPSEQAETSEKPEHDEAHDEKQAQGQASEATEDKAAEDEAAEDAEVEGIYPPLEEADEHSDLVAAHLSKYRKNYKAPQAINKPHLQTTNDAAGFQAINQNIEFTRMARDVKRRFGGSNRKQLEEEDDFDAFMDSPSGQQAPSETRNVPKVDVDETKQAWIDDLLR